MRSLAIIPARGGSKRIPKKNIKIFLGHPIIKYPIDSAINSKCFDKVMVSTDDEMIAKISLDFGAEVPFFRSSKNSSDSASTADVVMEVVENYKKQGEIFENICCIYPTAALISPSDLKKAMTLLREKAADAVVSIIAFSHPIQRAFKIKDSYLKMIDPENSDVNSQDLEKTYHDAGQFYCLNAKSFINQKKIFCDKMISYELPEISAQDVDNEQDWKLAELKYKLINKNL
jgi:pseudaminic acid cytidylyltransferase